MVTCTSWLASLCPSLFSAMMRRWYEVAGWRFCTLAEVTLPGTITFCGVVGQGSNNKRNEFTRMLFLGETVVFLIVWYDSISVFRIPTPMRLILFCPNFILKSVRNRVFIRVFLLLKLSFVCILKVLFFVVCCF